MAVGEQQQAAGADGHHVDHALAGDVGVQLRQRCAPRRQLRLLRRLLLRLLPLLQARVQGLSASGHGLRSSDGSRRQRQGHLESGLPPHLIFAAAELLRAVRVDISRFRETH